MAECKKCGVKLNFSNNFGGVCEGCYDNRHGEKKGYKEGRLFIDKMKRKSRREKTVKELVKRENRS